jgi:hypothetical protein
MRDVQPQARSKMNLIGTFNSKHDAEKAMKEMKQCKKA